MKDCLRLDNLDVQEWIDKEGANTTYEEYLKRGYLPDYKDWTGKEVSDDTAISILNSFFNLKNANVKTDAFSNLLYSLPENTAAAYLEQVIYLNKNPKKADVYEEGFHAIMDVILSVDEKSQVLKAGQSVLRNRLKQEGKTINQYVKELIVKYPTIYGKLSAEKALERAFEEEVASMFVDSFENKNYLKTESSLSKKLSPYFGDGAKPIASILARIFKFFKDIYNKFLGNQDSLSTLFEEIKNGKFRDRNNVVNGDGNNSVPFTRLLELFITKYDDDMEEDDTYLSHSLTSEATQKVIRNIGAIFFQLEGAKVYNSLQDRIDESIKLYFQLEPDFKEVQLDNENNIEALQGLKDDVKEYIDVFSSIVDFESDIVENEEETQSDFAKYDSSANENSTFETSYSKQLKLRIGKTGKVKSIHNITIGNKVIPIKLIESVNVLNVYYAFARTLGNTSSDKERWNRLYAFSNLEGNPDAKAFVDTLLFDLFHNNQLVKDNFNNEELEFQPTVDYIKELYDKNTSGFLIFPEGIKETISSTNASIVNSILKGFDLWKRNEYILTVDTTTKEHVLFDANLQSVKNSQYNEWVNSLQELYDSNKKNEIKYIKPEDIDQPLDEFDFYNELAKMRSFFGKLNIQLSDEYLKYSLLRSMEGYAMNELIGRAENKDLKSLIYNFKLPVELTITIDIINNQLSKKINGYLDTGNIKLITDFNDGIQGKLKTIAEGNGYFDERIPDNTFKRADGKTIYNYQNKTYFLQKIDEILKNPREELTYKTLIGDDKYLEEGAEFINDNYLLKKFQKEYRIALDKKDIFSFSANGLRQADSIFDEMTGDDFGKSQEDGVSAGNMSTRDFSIYLLSAAISNKSASNGTTPVYVGNFEASKTYEFVNLPFIKGLFKDGNTISQQGINIVKDEFKKEYNRIQKYAKSINKEKYQKYNTGNVAKISYGNDIENDFFYIPYKLVNGKKKIDFSAYRSMQFSDGVTNLIDDKHYTLSDKDTGVIEGIINESNEDEFTSENLVLSDNLLSSALLGKPFESYEIDDFVQDGINTLLNNTISYLKEDGVITNEIDSKSLEKIVVGTLLDNGYNKSNDKFEFKEGELIDNIKKILFSNMLNTMFLNQLMHGDQALLYKNDQIDMFKRFKGRNAAINSANTSTIAPALGITKVWNSMEILIHDEILIKSSIDGKIIERADGQNYGTSNYFRYFDYSQGRLNKNKAELYDLIDQGESTKPLENKIFSLKMFIPILKTVFFDGYTYLKKSDLMLTKELTSKFRLISEKEIKNHYLLGQVETVNGKNRPMIGATKEIVKWTNGNYYEVQPLPNRVTLHDRRKAMEGWRFDNETKSWTFTGREIMLSMPVSASKMLNVNVLKGSDLKSKDIEGSIRTIDLKFYGLQVESSVPHDKIPHFTQYIEIALNELKKNGTTMFTIDGKQLNVNQLLQLYQNALASRDKIRIKELVDEILDDDNNFKEQQFRSRFAKSLETSGADKQTIELVSKGYSLNHPLIKEKFISQIFSHFTKDGLSQKIAGDSATLVSSYGMKLIKQVVKTIVNGEETLTWRAIPTNSEEYNTIIAKKSDAEWEKLDFGDLLFYPDLEGKVNRSKHFDKDGKDISLQFALQNLGEGGYFIDELRHFKPRIEDGKITGYFDETILSKSNINQNENEIDKNEKYMFGVRIPSQDKHSGVNIEVVEMFAAYHGSMVSVPREIMQLSGSDFDVDKLYIHKTGGYYDKKGKFIPYKNDLDSLKEFQLDNNNELKTLVKANKLASVDYQKYYNELKELKAKKKITYNDFQALMQSFEDKIIGFDKSDFKGYYRIKEFVDNERTLDETDFENSKNRGLITRLKRRQEEIHNESDDDFFRIMSQFSEYKNIKDLYEDFYSFLKSSNNIQSVLETNLLASNERIQEVSLDQMKLPNSGNNKYAAYVKTYDGFSNRGYINNLLLQAQQQALANIETMDDGGIADTSASLTYKDKGILVEFPVDLNDNQRDLAKAESQKIYDLLGDKTQSNNVVLPEDLNLVYDNKTFWSKFFPEFRAYNGDRIIVAFRGNGKKTFAENFSSWGVTKNPVTIGNPFDIKQEAGNSEQKAKKATIKFINWLISGNNFGVESATNEYRNLIIDNIKSGELKGRPIGYYQEKNYATHATALDYLINKYDWNNVEINNFKSTAIRSVNISKNSNDVIGKRLTNPNKGAKDLMDLEEPYKANASIKKAPELNMEDALKYDMNLMYTLQVQKFKTHPELIDEINEKGGLKFLQKATHWTRYNKDKTLDTNKESAQNKNDRWIGVGQNSNFIKVLIQSYSKVSKELGKFKENNAVVKQEKNSDVPIGEKIKDGIYLNQEGLSKEEQLELFEYLKPIIEEQAVKSNNGEHAPKMIGLSLNWDYVNGVTKRKDRGFKRVDVGKSLRPNDTYGWFSSSANGEKLYPITKRLVELMTKISGIDVTNYDGAIINLYTISSLIGNHSDIDESITAKKYPVVVANIGGTGSIILGTDKANDGRQLKAGSAYLFGFKGENREIPHSTYASAIDGFLPAITTKIDGQTYNEGSYRISITIRRVMPLTEGMPDEPKIVNNQLQQSNTETKPTQQAYLLSDDGGKTFVGQNKRKYNVHSMLGHLITHKNNTTGGKNIGVDVNWNLLDIVLNRLDVKVNPKNSISVEINGKEENFDSLQLFLNHKMESGGEYLRVFDVLSTMISSATDEAKEQLNARYGLTIDALNAVLPLVAMGGNLSIGIALVNQPIIKEFLSYKAKKNYAILTKAEAKLKYMNNQKIVEDMFKYPNSYSSIIESELVYSIEDLAKGLRKKSLVYTDIDEAMLRDFLRLSDITEFGNNIIAGIKTKKGLPTDIYSFNDTLVKLSKLQFKGEDRIDKSPLFIKEKLTKELETTDDLAKELIGKIDIYNDIDNILPKLITLKTPIFNKYRNTIRNQSKENWSNTELKELDAELESFIYSQLLYKTLEDAGEFDELLVKYLKASLTNINSKDNIINIFNSFKTAIMNNPLLNNNSLIKKLQAIEESGISFLKINQLVKLNDNQMTELADAFTFLANRAIPINGAISPLEMTKALQALYIIKDGMQFKYKGISKLFPVEVFSRMSTNIDAIMRGDISTIGFLNNESMIDEFQKRYFESVKHKNSSKIITIFEDTEAYSLLDLGSMSLVIARGIKGSGLTTDSEGRLLKYITLKKSNNIYKMKLSSDEDGIIVYQEHVFIGTTNSTSMGLPMDRENFDLERNLIDPQYLGSKQKNYQESTNSDADNIAKLEQEIELLEAKQDTIKGTAEYYILDHLPKITSVSAEDETGGKVSMDIASALINNTTGMSVERASEEILNNSRMFESIRDLTVQDIRNIIIEILLRGKNNYKEDLLETKKLKGLKKLLKEIKKDKPTENGQTAFNETCLGLNDVPF